MKPTDLYRMGFNPYYQRIMREGRGRLSIDQTVFFDLASNDYLGMAVDPRVKTAMADAVERFGTSFCGTPIAAGYADVLADLESAVATMVGLPAAVVFPSCYQANGSLFCSIADMADVVIVDHYAHASLIHGIKTSGARIKPFLHNNILHLEKQLAASQNFRRIFVVTESVFSTEGSIAPFAEIDALCKRYNATPVIDDSHGIGVIGKTGRGILEHCGIVEYDGIYTASLGKALAGTGGIVAGAGKFIEYLRYTCAGLIYSTALVPASAAGLLASIRIIATEFDARGSLMWQTHRDLNQRLTNAGFNLKGGQAPIASVFCGSAERTISLAKLFFEQGILTTPFIPPSVPPEQGVVRLIIGAKVDTAAMMEIGKRIDSIGERFSR
jgi:7-keto-8-aminopelargonate synthetase-like enzyme